MVNVLEKYFKMKKKPILCGAFGTGHTLEMARLIEEKRIPIFYSIEEAVTAAEAIAG